MQSEDQNSLYTVYPDYIPKAILKRDNKKRAWEYGYNSEYDMVVISKDGTVGDVYNINGLFIALPSEPTKVYKISSTRSEQYWERKDLPPDLGRIKTIFQWNDRPIEFRNKWVGYIDEEFDRRENGFFFMNNGIPTYITGGHYMYLQWTKIDIGYADFREANRILYIYWEAAKADRRSYGINYVKIRRSGFSYMSSEECVNIATISKNARVGILSKTGTDAKKMFTGKVVVMNTHLPFFFKPIMDGMDKPKTELVYSVPASKMTKKSMSTFDDEEDPDGLNTTIDWRNTEDNSYDGEKLQLLVHDEASKWLKPNNILNNWRVTKTCLKLGGRVVGKCMMGSTVNASSKGGAEYKKMYQDSDISVRNKNGETKSGLYSLFIPMEWNFEGYIDRYGMPVFRKPDKPVVGVDGQWIDNGAIDYWEAEAESKKSDPDALNEFYRQFPRTISHAFRDDSKDSLFNLTKIYQQIDYNDSIISEHYLTRGSFSWENGIRDTKVVWSPDIRGRFLVSWLPPKQLQNRIIVRNGIKYPANEHIGAFGCDSYDISGVVGGVGSNGALHGLTKFTIDDAPSNEFFLEYIARPQTAEIFFEDVLMACVFCGMPILVENNKPRLLYHFRNRGYRGFSINRPDRDKHKLSTTERELGGIPNSSQDVIQIHSAAIESYIEKYIGYDVDGTFRDSDQIGIMPFNRTLMDWAKFDITNRTKHDASISSGLAIMANQKHLYQAEKKESKIKINFARYTNKGAHSELIK